MIVILSALVVDYFRDSNSEEYNVDQDNDNNWGDEGPYDVLFMTEETMLTPVYIFK